MKKNNTFNVLSNKLANFTSLFSAQFKTKKTAFTTTNNKTSTQTKFMRLGIIGLISIMGLVMMLNISQEIDAQVTFVQLERTPTAILNTDFNPCKDVNCGLGAKAKFIGKDNTALTELHPYGGNTLCQCPDGKRIATRPYTPRRY